MEYNFYICIGEIPSWVSCWKKKMIFAESAALCECCLAGISACLVGTRVQRGRKCHLEMTEHVVNIEMFSQALKWPSEQH